MNNNSEDDECDAERGSSSINRLCSSTEGEMAEELPCLNTIKTEKFTFKNQSTRALVVANSAANQNEVTEQDDSAP